MSEPTAIEPRGTSSHVASTPPVDVRDLDNDELAVLAQLARGCSNREIAQALGIAEAIVYRLMTSIMAKLGARNRYQAMMIAHCENLDSATRSTTSAEPDLPSPQGESPVSKSTSPPEPARVVPEPAVLADPCPRPVAVDLERLDLASAELSVLDLHRVRYGALDERHREVMRLIATGYDDTALGYALSLPYTVVHLIVNALIHTFGVRARADLQALGLELFPGIKRLRQRVVPNEVVITPSVAEFSAAGTQRPPAVSPTALSQRGSTVMVGNPLSEREQRVMDAFAGGASTNVAIAKSLWLQEDTVKTHFKRIFLKLRVDSRYEALAVCLTNGWVSDCGTSDDAEHMDRLAHVRKTWTGRKLDVLELIAAGHSNQEIARKLNIALNTAKGYVQEIFRQLQPRDRRHVVILVHRARTVGVTSTRSNADTGGDM